jgi:hypothetical protein
VRCTSTVRGIDITPLYSTGLVYACVRRSYDTFG